MPWICPVVNEFGEARIAWLEGYNVTDGASFPISREQAQAKADVALRNWKHGPVVFTTQNRPLNQKALPPSAHQFGALKSINKLRRR